MPNEEQERDFMERQLDSQEAASENNLIVADMQTRREIMENDLQFKRWIASFDNDKTGLGFQQFLMKEIKNSNIPQKDLPFYTLKVEQMITLMMQFHFNGHDLISRYYYTKLQALLGTTSSRDGFERQEQNSMHHGITKQRITRQDNQPGWR